MLFLLTYRLISSICFFSSKILCSVYVMLKMVHSIICEQLCDGCIFRFIPLNIHISPFKRNFKTYHFAAAFLPCHVPPVTARTSDSANWRTLCALQIYILYCIVSHLWLLLLLSFVRHFTAFSSAWLPSQGILKLKVKVKRYSSSWQVISELRGITCHMGSHSVTCHPTQVNSPHLTPAKQAGTWFTYPGEMEGWVDPVGDLLHTEMVYPPADGHPSKY